MNKTIQFKAPSLYHIDICSMWQEAMIVCVVVLPDVRRLLDEADYECLLRETNNLLEPGFPVRGD